MSDFREMSETVSNSDFETFIKKVKELSAFGVYEIAVRNGDAEKATANILEISTLLATMDDDEFHVLTMRLSHDLLFAVADQQLRGEILGDKERPNENKSNDIK